MRESHEKAVQGSHGHGDGGFAAASGGDRGRGILSSPFFTIGTLVGMGCVFLCLPLFFIAWILQLRQSVKTKQYGWALCIAIFGIFLIVRGLLQIW